VQIEGKEGRISRSSNNIRGDKDGEGKGERSIRVADTKVCQRHTKVLRVGELLSLIYRELCINSEATARYGEKG